MKTLLRLFFRLLYHQFAFAYDLVAAAVSFNRWKDWVMSVIPFLEGPRVLEIGHGPGHLQRALRSRGLVAVGIDESFQMGRLAKRDRRREADSRAQSQPTPVHGSPGASSTLPQFAYTRLNLARGLAQHLPFPKETFTTVVATFPAEYIFEQETLVETQRVLAPGGRFVILPGALITGRGVLDRVLAWLFRVTGETPPDLAEIIRERSQRPFAKAGFRVETHEINVRSSLVFIILAIKTETTEEINHAPKTT